MWTGTKAERRAYDRQRYHRRRNLILEILGNKCALCSATETLEIDHKIKTSKAFDIGKVWTKPMSEIVVELKKCQLLCKDCHKKKSDKEGERPTPHGTISGYYHRGCRCDACRAAYSTYRKERRLVGKDKRE
jgi:5-methylcytosine-specific restriction endonuclease McrA